MASNSKQVPKLGNMSSTLESHFDLKLISNSRISLVYFSTSCLFSDFFQFIKYTQKKDLTVFNIITAVINCISIGGHFDRYTNTSSYDVVVFHEQMIIIHHPGTSFSNQIHFSTPLGFSFQCYCKYPAGSRKVELSPFRCLASQLIEQHVG